MKRNLITVIRRSCLTGKVVWIYRGQSEHAAVEAYRRACQREVERFRNWSEKAADRMQNITRLLNDCLQNIPFTAELTPRQRESAQLLRDIGSSQLGYQADFYEHIMEERRRRLKNAKNSNYDK